MGNSLQLDLNDISCAIYLLASIYIMSCVEWIVKDNEN